SPRTNASWRRDRFCKNLVKEMLTPLAAVPSRHAMRVMDSESRLGGGLTGSPMAHSRRRRPVFQDPTGRRARVSGRVARTVAIASSLLAAALVLGLLIPPLLPRIVIANAGPTQGPQFAATRL